MHYPGFTTDLCVLTVKWERTQENSHYLIMAFLALCLLFLQWEKEREGKANKVQHIPLPAGFPFPVFNVSSQKHKTDRMITCWGQVLLPIQRPSLRYQVPGLHFEVNQTPPLRSTWAEGYISTEILSGIAAVIWAKIKVPFCDVISISLYLYRCVCVCMHAHTNTHPFQFDLLHNSNK